MLTCHSTCSSSSSSSWSTISSHLTRSWCRRSSNFSQMSDLLLIVQMIHLLLLLRRQMDLARRQLHISSSVLRLLLLLCLWLNLTGLSSTVHRRSGILLLLLLLLLDSLETREIHQLILICLLMLHHGSLLWLRLWCRSGTRRRGRYWRWWWFRRLSVLRCGGSCHNRCRLMR